MEELLKSESQEVKRPWQTFLLVFIMIFLFFRIISNFLVNMALNIQTKCLESNLVEEQIKICKSSKIISSLVISFVVSLFGIFFIWKTFKGKKWVIVLFTIQGLITALFVVVGIFIGKLSVFGVIFSVSEMYALIYCLKHPFYNQKKIK